MGRFTDIKISDVEKLKFRFLKNEIMKMGDKTININLYYRRIVFNLDQEVEIIGRILDKEDTFNSFILSITMKRVNSNFTITHPINVKTFQELNDFIKYI